MCRRCIFSSSGNGAFCASLYSVLLGPIQHEVLWSFTLYIHVVLLSCSLINHFIKRKRKLKYRNLEHMFTCKMVVLLYFMCFYFLTEYGPKEEQIFITPSMQTVPLQLHRWLPVHVTFIRTYSLQLQLQRQMPVMFHYHIQQV